MQAHFNLSDESYNSLIKDGITTKDFYLTAQFFDPYNKGAEPSAWSLLYYLDLKGDFRNKPQFPHRKIVTAFFETLTAKEKMNIFDLLEGDEED